MLVFCWFSYREKNKKKTDTHFNSPPLPQKLHGVRERTLPTLDIIFVQFCSLVSPPPLSCLHENQSV